MMTPEEFKATRLMWGLTQEWIAEQLGVSHPAVVKWESGRSKINREAQAMMININALFEDIISHGVRYIKEQTEEQGAEPEVVNLVGYRTTADLHRYRPDMQPFPASSHNIILTRLRNALAQMGVLSRIIYLEPDKYEAWLERAGKSDSETSRAEYIGLE